LGLGSDASLADIKKAFRQKAALFHPDRNTAADASARFRAVQEAYDVLADPHQAPGV
jgi:curved DNA-binding protein CbpA